MPPSPHTEGHSDQEDERDLPKNSAELARYDREVLDDEEEQEKLLMSQGDVDGRRQYFKDRRHEDRSERKALRQQRREERRSSRTERKGRTKESAELMHEIEEGGPRSSSSSSVDSSELDREKIGVTQATRKKTNRRRCCYYTLIYLFIALAFVAIGLGAWRASGGRLAMQEASDTVLFNGTSSFLPTTILVSLDGFRADYLDRDITPTLAGFIRSGVSPKYMTPSFPSVTFPNHFTMVTGLYPESHGVVGNTFWDPELDEEFYYTHQSVSMQSKWWNAEPLWETAELQNVRTAIHMWPGSEAHIGSVDPAYVDKFNSTEILSNKVDRILELLDKPGAFDGSDGSDVRPQFIAAYVPNVDRDGHLHGPNSTEIRDTIREVDDMLADLLHGLEARNLTNVVNLVVVSDHGMATTSNERLIQFEDLVDPALITHTDGWPSYGLRLKDASQLAEMHTSLLAKAAASDGFDVYLRDSTMPARYHFTANARIAPLWLVPRPGWAIVTRDEYDVAAGRASGAVFHPRGIHGYDHEHPLMRAVFVARGPAFPHPPGAALAPFQNTNVYNILADSLGVVPRANNGTLRLPLAPVGVHGGGTSASDGSDDGELLDGAPLQPSYYHRPSVHKVEPTPIPFDLSPAPDRTDAARPPKAPSKADGDGGGDDEGQGADDDASGKTWSEWFSVRVQALQDWLDGLDGLWADAVTNAEAQADAEAGGDGEGRA